MSNESVEMYLKRLYEFYLIDPSETIRTSKLAQAMQVSDASASEMMVRLGARGLVNRVAYKGATLSEDGVRMAAAVKRREQLLEIFLNDMLAYTGDLNEAACRLEHALTPELELLIDRMLGYPERSIDGDEIPAVSRRIEPYPAEVLMPLRALPKGSSGVVTIMLFDGSVVRTLEDAGLLIDSVVRRESDSFLVNDGDIHLSEELTKRIFIRLQG